MSQADLGRYLEGQGHSMTLQQNHVRPISWLYEVWFYNYFTEMITILRRHVANNIRVDTLKVKVTAWPCNKIVSGHNFVFWSRIYKYFTEMITILRWLVAHNSWVATFKVKVTLQQNRIWPITYYIVIWSRILQLFHRNHHHIWMTCLMQILVTTVKVKVTAWPWSKIVSGPLLRYLKWDFKTISQK